MALTDILGKTGQQGGIEAISQLFGGHGMQGILSAMQSNGNREILVPAASAE